MGADLPPPPDLHSAQRLLESRRTMYDRINDLVISIETSIGKDEGSQRSLSALASLIRHLRLAQDEVIRAEWIEHSYRQASPEDLDEDAYMEELRTAADGMVEQHLRVFVDAWLERHEMVAVSAQEEARSRFEAARPPLRVEVSEAAL